MILAAFRASAWWGLALFVSPIVGLASLAFGGLSSQQGIIALVAGIALTVVAWLGFLVGRWKDARQGFLVILIGTALSAATWFLYAPPELEAKAWMTYQALRNRLPWLPQAGDTPPAATAANAPGNPPAIEQVPWPSPGTASPAATPAATGPALAVNAAAAAEVRRTLERLSGDAQKLQARSQKLAGSRDAAALRQLSKDIEEYNAQRTAALKRAADLKIPIGDPQPTATPAPAASPARKK